ncbi:unnamed protein product [Mytilus coruscus]|uniref:B box-type domain-containing protein n=1 Tax=Mytilus coruscus TaxID=42192 RepID=A0A6J7ZZ52_MYTCO|nr:unnamed protein product [Mytilus coruscus]
MASNWSICGACNNQQITIQSVVWCSECKEGLCANCKEHHTVLMGTRHHATVSIVEYKKLTTGVCKTHNEIYELFCRNHDCLCCKCCVKSHKDCKDLTEINEVIKTANREDNLTSLENKKREIEAEIKQTRSKINNHLDKIQDDLMNELMVMEQKESIEIRKLLSTLRTKEQEIGKYQALFANIKQYASDLQAFTSMKHIEKDIAIAEKFIQSLTKSDTTNQVNISCQINKSLQETTANVQNFGEISVSSDPCDLSIQKRKDKQAQITVALPTRNMDTMTLTLQKLINTDLSNVRGCSILPEGRMLFSSYSENKVIVLKSDGSKDFEINNIGGTFDVVFIGDDSIAVTSSGFSNEINIVDIKNNKLRKTITVNSDNDGVAYKDGNLFYCAREKGLQMISLSDETITNVTNKNLYYSYVTTFEDKLFYTNYNDDSVTCCDYHGNMLWTYKDSSVLEHPLGISVDNDGDVFVVGYHTHNVIVISPDGQRYRQLLSSEDGLRYPWVLHYEQLTNKILVANETKDTFLYEAKLV